MYVSKVRFDRTIRISIALIALITIPVRGFASSKQPSPGVVQARAEADVTGDHIDDTILLMGYESELGGPFCHSHELIVVDGAAKKEIALDLGDWSAGYPGSLATGDITGDRIPEIVVSIPTGGSGGITNYLILSALDGNLHFLADPEELARGPELATRSLDHFTIEIVDKARDNRFLLGLSRPDEFDESDPYTEYYSESGTLVKPIDICVDDVSAAELSPADDKGSTHQFVTYQKIWAIYHANSVGIARTTWRYVGGKLEIANVEVTPLLVPDVYSEYLKSIDCSDPARAVERAISDYRARFLKAPPAFRDQAFAEFREFHLEIARAKAKSLEQAAGIVDAKNSDEILAAYTRLPQIAADKKASPTFTRAGLTTVYSGEGLWTVEPQAGFYARQFRAMLSPSVVSFLELDEVERNKPWLADGALVVSVEELGRRTALWEAYIENNPYSIFEDEAKLRFNRAVSALLLGTNNTPHYDDATGLERPEALGALASHAEAYPKTRSGKAAGDVVEILKKHANGKNGVAKREIRRIVDETIYAD